MKCVFIRKKDFLIPILNLSDFHTLYILYLVLVICKIGSVFIDECDDVAMRFVVSRQVGCKRFNIMFSFYHFFNRNFISKRNGGKQFSQHIVMLKTIDRWRKVKIIYWC